MGLRLRLIAFAVAAVSLGGAQHPQVEARAEQNQAAQIEHGSSRIPDAIRETGTKKDKGCEDRKDERGSDLCAQWGAVDAARNAAYATWAAVFLSFVGTFLIFLTFRETRRTSRRELRAYVSVLPKGLPVFTVGEKPRATIAIANGGTTPAYEVTQYGTVMVAEFPMKSDPLAGEIEHHGVRGFTTLHRGDSYGAPIECHEELSQADLDAFRSGEKVIYVIGNVDYRDAFNQARRTEFCYFLDKEALSRARRRETGAMLKGKTVTVELRWTMGNLHTKST
jgi:hypothetical protein